MPSHARSVSLYRSGQSGRPRRRAHFIWLVWACAGIVGRNHSAMAGAAASGVVLLYSATDHSLRFLLILLFRKLAVHRNLHGGCPCHGLASGHRRRFRLHRARLAHHFLQPGRFAVRHENRRSRKFSGLARDAGNGGLAGTDEPDGCSELRQALTEQSATLTRFGLPVLVSVAHRNVQRGVSQTGFGCGSTMGLLPVGKSAHRRSLWTSGRLQPPRFSDPVLPGGFRGIYPSGLRGLQFPFFSASGSPGFPSAGPTTICILTIAPSCRLRPTLLKTKAGSDEFVTEKYLDQIAAILAQWSAGFLKSPQDVRRSRRILASRFLGGLIPPGRIADSASRLRGRSP